jgi:hypothetical protein
MDKITSHVIQMDPNPRPLNSRDSNTRASDSEVSDLKVLEALDAWVSEVSNPSPWSRIRDVVSKAQGLRRSWALTYLGFDLG